jgi:galactonate dehydratase
VAVSIQLDACIPNFIIQEFEHTHAERGYHDILVNPLVVKKGFISIPTEPGLGIELNEEALEKYPYQPRKHLRSTLPYQDGSIF